MRVLPFYKTKTPAIVINLTPRQQILSIVNTLFDYHCAPGLDELSKPGSYERLNRIADDLCRESQAVLDHHQIPAIAQNTGSLWQILFTDKTPRNQADILASDQASMRRLDSLLMKQGQYVLPGVRRFVSTVHTSEDLEDTVKGVDAACRQFND